MLRVIDLYCTQMLRLHCKIFLSTLRYTSYCNVDLFSLLIWRFFSSILWIGRFLRSSPLWRWIIFSCLLFPLFKTTFRSSSTSFFSTASIICYRFLYFRLFLFNILLKKINNKREKMKNFYCFMYTTMKK